MSDKKNVSVQRHGSQPVWLRRPAPLRGFWLLLACLGLLFGLLPAAEARADNDFAAEAVEVTVTALSRENREAVPVEGATVTLSQWGRVLVSAESGPDGKAVLSLDGLSKGELQNATVEAYVTTDRGMATAETGKDDLFSHYPKDENGETYRYEYQLHSETIDDNGNWVGQALPFSVSSQADIVFIIDGTGSMEDELSAIKPALKDCLDSLKKLDYDFRYSVIEYRDPYYDQDPIVHEKYGSHWFTDEDTVIGIIQGIEADGGGDPYEGLKDTLALDLLDEEDMGFRRDSYRLAYIITDAYTQLETRDGSSVWADDLNEELKAQNIAASFVTTCELEEEYRPIFENTGGEWFDISSATLGTDLFSHTEQLLTAKTAKMELHLSEPRLLVNMSLCYLADDERSRSESYRDSVANLLSIYSQTMAQATDGHVYLDKAIVFSADSFMDFNTEGNLAAMADIQIHTREGDEALMIRSNATVNGFYSARAWDNSGNLNWFDDKSLDLSEFAGGKSYARIQMSGTEGGDWGFSFIETPEIYAATMMHESGHYIFGFRDEYFDQDKKNWREKDDKPYPMFGLMDNQHEDVEISKQSMEYRYLADYYSNYPITTYHYWRYWASCERVLADLLTKGRTFPVEDRIQSTEIILSEPVFNIPYYAVYTTAPWAYYGMTDRTASYPYAGLEDDDFIYLNDTADTSPGSEGSPASPLPGEEGSWLAWFMGSSRAEGGGEDSHGESSGEDTGSSGIGSDGEYTGANIRLSSVSLGGFYPTPGKDTFTAEADDEEGASYTVCLRKQGEAGFTVIPLLKGEDGRLAADLPVSQGDLAEIYLAKEKDGVLEYNTWFIDQTEPAKGFVYTSPDGKVAAYGAGEEETAFTIMADNSAYENGEYFSLNQATWLSTAGASITKGGIYSAASSTGELDFSSICWFKYDGETWTPLSTDISMDENVNIGASAELDGDGLYVLMGKKAKEEPVEAPSFLVYEPSASHDGEITLSFDDPGEDTMFYYVSYTDDPDADPIGNPVRVKVITSDSCVKTSDTGRSVTLNLWEREKLCNVAVTAVKKDGSRSPAAVVQVSAPAADRDGDGIPDWYVDKYLLWGNNFITIAADDPDGDGLTNLEEYLGGTDPTIPDAPESAPQADAEETIRQQEETIHSLEERLALYEQIIRRQQDAIRSLEEELEELQIRLEELRP